MAKQRQPSLKDGILRVLSSRGALQRSALMQALDGDHTVDHLSVALTELKRAGLVERANNQCWRVTAVGRAEARALPPLAEPPAAAPDARHQEIAGRIPMPDPDHPDPATARLRCDRPAPFWDIEHPPHHWDIRLDGSPIPRPQDRLDDPSTGPSVITALEFFARVAQDTLDEYVYSVGDRSILDRLKAARDAAQEALRHYQEAV